MNECLCKYTNKVSHNEIYLVKVCKKRATFTSNTLNPSLTSKKSNYENIT